ncbi:MAG: M15 family metallopeptidase [Vulcanococcus sp.]
MPSAGRQTSDSRPGLRKGTRTAAMADDIPLATRTLSPSLQRRSRAPMLLLGAGAVLVAAALSALLFPKPIARLVTPPPLKGLDARLSSDGRLLGHFPYAEASDADLISIGPGVLMNPEAAEALNRMRRAADADGIDLRVLSAFRSIALQKQIFFDVKSQRNQSARERAQVSAPPGFSEHSTGFAVDLGDGRQPQTNLSTSFDQTEAFRWLQQHANRFHFALSFPDGNKQGVSYEPWHWRFEGSADALKTFDAAQRFER